MLKEHIQQLINRQDLDKNSCDKIVNAILDPKTDPLQISAFLVLLRAKPETAAELTGIVTHLRKKMIPVPTKHKVLDIVGTGGDGANTINISTGSAILAASCGIKIAKHGNRAVFSPNFNPAIRELRILRKKLNVPTAFNLLGPLLNPANAKHFLLGVMDEILLPVISEVLRDTGSEKSMVVHGFGLDEISCLGPSKIIEINKNELITSFIDPKEFGLSYCTISNLRGGNADENAKILRGVFSGKKGAVADTLVLNAAVALYLYGIHSSIAAAVFHAKEALYSGATLKLLTDWIEFCHD